MSERKKNKPKQKKKKVKAKRKSVPRKFSAPRFGQRIGNFFSPTWAKLVLRLVAFFEN